MDTTACHRATEGQKQTFSTEIDGSKTRNLNAAKRGPGKRCTAVCQNNSCACIKSTRVSQPVLIAVHVRTFHPNHSVSRDSVYAASDARRAGKAGRARWQELHVRQEPTYDVRGAKFRHPRTSYFEPASVSPIPPVSPVPRSYPSAW